jgi:[ribosomal protein S5]-alanine N-acetyltransferase
MRSMLDRIVLHTARLVLRPFEPSDVYAALAYRNDAEFARYLPHVPLPFHRSDAEEFVARNMSEPWHLFPTFAVVEQGTLIGTVNLEIKWDTQMAMLGYAIATRAWGRGLATEAARAVTTWGFEVVDAARIWASSDARNVRSRRVLDKLGMQLEGVPARSHHGA